MTPDAVRTLVEELGVVGFSGAGFRHLSLGTPPLSGHGAWLNGGRWNPPRSFPVLYLGLVEDTVKAEFYRMAEKLGRKPEDFLPREIRRYDVLLGRVVDLRDPAARSHIGLSDADLESDPPVVCQAIGLAAHELGREGLLAPSATGVGVALPIFFGRLDATSSIEPKDAAVWTLPP